MSALVLSSPAKVNLFLRVLGRRPDGYHAIASLLHAVDHIADTLTFSLAKEDRFTCSDPSLLSHNLVTRAIDLFRQKTGLLSPCAVHLNKVIPVQSGLGGGSSNAAVALQGMNQLFGSPIPLEELQRWSVALGSDVPFFFSSGTAYCTGRGEIVRALPPFQGKLEIFKPEVGLSTAAVYQALRLEECSSRDPEELLEHYLRGTPVLWNDLEPPALRLLPCLQAFKTAWGGTMSGSGTAYFKVG